MRPSLPYGMLSFKMAWLLHPCFSMRPSVSQPFWDCWPVDPFWTRVSIRLEALRKPKTKNGPPRVFGAVWNSDCGRALVRGEYVVVDGRHVPRRNHWTGRPFGHWQSILCLLSVSTLTLLYSLVIVAIDRHMDHLGLQVPWLTLVACP